MKIFKKSPMLSALSAVAVLSCAANADQVVGITNMVMNPDTGSYNQQTFQNWGATAGDCWYNGEGLESALNDGDAVPATLPNHVLDRISQPFLLLQE